MKAYENLVSTGCVGSFKRDSILDASSDAKFLSDIRGAFMDAGDEARLVATECAVMLIEDLVSKGFCNLAAWSSEGTGHLILDLGSDEIARAIDWEQDPGSQPFGYFLVTTELGDDWVKRYDTLVAEL
ncbi:MAG TPA: hypothetical protein VGC54_09330 [Planctomycetota bacterium]